MPIIVEKSNTHFEVPEEGLYQAVLADVVDLGEVETTFGLKHQVRFVYVLTETDSEGRQFRLFQRLNASINEKSIMYKVIRKLSGNKEIGASFDLESLLGKQCQLDVQQNEKEGKVYANVAGVLSSVKGQNVKVPVDFQRDADRPKQDKPKSATPKAAAPKAAAPKVANTQPTGNSRTNKTGVTVKPQAAPQTASEIEDEGPVEI